MSSIPSTCRSVSSLRYNNVENANGREFLNAHRSEPARTGTTATRRPSRGAMLHSVDAVGASVSPGRTRDARWVFTAVG